jgi:hypothetical protein
MPILQTSDSVNLGLQISLDMKYCGTGLFPEHSFYLFFDRIITQHCTVAEIFIKSLLIHHAVLYADSYLSSKKQNEK